MTAVQSDAAADQEWKALMALSPARITPAPRPVDENQPPKPIIQQEIEALQKAAQQARSFYTAHPGDAHVGAAKKLEVVWLLQAIQLGDEENSTESLALAGAFRGDATGSVRDRLDVALILETLAATKSRQGRGLRDDGSTFENTVDRLHTEFGDDEAVYHLYLNVIRTCDDTTALRVARRVVQMPKAPGWAKQQAQPTIDRLSGKPNSQ